MKWLLVQSGIPGHLNPKFREAEIINEALIELGQESMVWGLNQPNFDTPPKFDSFDVLFVLENYGDGWLPDLSQINEPYKIMWSVDAHVRGMEPFEYMFNQGRFNLMLNSTVDFVTQPHHAWCPNYLAPSLIKKLDDVEKVTPLGFCGTRFNHNHLRNQVADILINDFDMKWDEAVAENMVRAINSYRVHFNMNIGNDVNFRNFETLGCGTALLVNDNHQYPTLGFVDGENYFSYRSMDELIDKVRFLADNPDEADRVAANGLELGKQHTIEHRMDALIAFLDRS